MGGRDALDHDPGFPGRQRGQIPVQAPAVRDQEIVHPLRTVRHRGQVQRPDQQQRTAHAPEHREQVQPVHRVQHLHGARPLGQQLPLTTRKFTDARPAGLLRRPPGDAEADAVRHLVRHVPGGHPGPGRRPGHRPDLRQPPGGLLLGHPGVLIGPAPSEAVQIDRGGHPVRTRRRVHRGHHAAQRVTRHRHPAGGPGRRQGVVQVGADLGEVPGAGRCAAAVAGQVHREHPVPSGQSRRGGGPVGRRPARAVQQKEKRPVAAVVAGVQNCHTGHRRPPEVPQDHLPERCARGPAGR